MDYWKNKIAVVTRASGGIGLQILLDLAREGLTVIGLARTEAKIEAAAAAELKESIAGKIFARHCDISNIDSIRAAFQWIEEEFGVVHVIVNNAAAATKAGTTLDEAVPHEDISLAINTNLTGLVVCTREAYRLMKKHNDLGYIINMNSVRGHVSPLVFMNFTNVYSATKFAVTNHTETIRLDLAHEDNKRIRVTSLSPGLVKTQREGLIGGGYSGTYEKNPFLLPKDISDAVKYLLTLPPNVNVQYKPFFFFFFFFPYLIILSIFFIACKHNFSHLLYFYILYNYLAGIRAYN